jgi:cytochrome c5
MIAAYRPLRPRVSCKAFAGTRYNPDFARRLRKQRMQEIHIQEHSSPIKNWKQLLVVGVLAFVVPVFLIIAIVQIVTGGLKVDPGSLAMSEEAIAARLKPAGEARLTLGDAPAAAAPSVAGVQSAAAVPAAQPATAARSGNEVYQQACAMCHAAGLAGAPKAGDAAAWKARIAQGVPTLHNHAINGIRAMPAKGGNPSLSDAEVKAAVDYLVAQVK